MRKRIRLGLLIILMILVIGIIRSVAFAKSNENGNMANMGLVLEDGNVVYYNKYEKGIFAYKDGKEERLTEETAYSLTSFENKVYYITIADFSNVVIKCMDRNGANLKTVATIYTSSSKFFIQDGWIYYLTGKGNKGIARIDVNGENETILVEGNIQDFHLVKNEIFYINETNQIAKIEISSQKNIVINEEVTAKKLQVVDQWIYYYDQNENALFRMNKNGKKKELVSVLVKNEIYNVSGKYVYFLDKENSKIAKMRIGKSNQCVDIVEVHTSNTRLNITNDELYYLDKSQDEAQMYQMYRVKLNGDKTKKIEY